MKVCSKCKTDKDLSSFNKDVTKKDGLRPDCKVCLRAVKKVYYESKKDSYYTLYYLPEEHYIGVSCRPKGRVRDHRNRNKIVVGWESVATFKTKREALDAEAYMHEAGYNGINKTMYKIK
tara:strand:+ start:38 stop:397 length:360 start_codon:yes stop_codon:yes gene_type:complete